MQQKQNNIKKTKTNKQKQKTMGYEHV
jgi:hypothetical protein